MTTKKCKLCSEEKPVIMFQKHKTGILGVRGICKQCVKNSKQNYSKPLEGYYICNVCKVLKHVNEFSKNSSVSRGVRYACKECENIKTRERRKHTQDKSAEYSRKRRLILKNRIRMNLGTRLWQVVSKKHGNTMELTGCTTEFLMAHLESKFSEGMSWDNYGKWHIDHIKPCASFNLENVEEQQKCFHWTNLQPLWAKDNIKKGSKF